MASESVGRQRNTYVMWLGSAAILAVAWIIVCATLNLMVDRPNPLGVWLLGALLWFPVGLGIARLTGSRRVASRAFIESAAIGGVAVLVALAYLVFVVGIDGTPSGHERDVLLSSLIAALV